MKPSCWYRLWSNGPHSSAKTGRMLPATARGSLRATKTHWKENEILLIYKEIETESIAKSFVRKGFFIYEEMRKYFAIYKEGVSLIWLCNRSLLNFLIYEENSISFFISAPTCVLLSLQAIHYPSLTLTLPLFHCMSPFRHSTLKKTFNYITNFEKVIGLIHLLWNTI